MVAFLLAYEHVGSRVWALGNQALVSGFLLWHAVELQNEEGNKGAVSEGSVGGGGGWEGGLEGAPAPLTGSQCSVETTALH